MKIKVSLKVRGQKFSTFLFMSDFLKCSNYVLLFFVIKNVWVGVVLFEIRKKFFFLNEINYIR